MVRPLQLRSSVLHASRPSTSPSRTPSTPIPDDSHTASSTLTQPSPLSHSESVEAARAFLQLDRELSSLFRWAPLAASSWVCRHTCCPRDCRTHPFSGRPAAMQHNVSTRLHHHCDAQCAMHKHLYATAESDQTLSRARNGRSASGSHDSPEPATIGARSTTKYSRFT